MSEWRVRLGRKLRGGQLETYTLDVHGGGRRRRISLRTTDAEKAERMLADFRRNGLPELERAAAAPAEQNTTLTAILDYYTGTYLPVRGASPRTITEAIRILREFELYCRASHIGRAQQLTRSAVDAHAKALHDRGLASKSVHTALSIIRAALNAAVEAGLLNQSPIAKWLMPRYDDPEIDPLTAEQLARLLDIVARRAPEVSSIVHWIAHTGNRPSDARGLRWSQVNMDTRTVQRTQVKTGRLATYQIGDAAMDVLIHERNRRGSEYVFTNDAGKPFTKNVVLYRLQRALRAEGFERPVCLKDLRHTFGFLMANRAGCPLPILQQLMGHSSIEMTMRYVRPGDAQAALGEYLKMLAPRGTTKKRRCGAST